MSNDCKECLNNLQESKEKKRFEQMNLKEKRVYLNNLKILGKKDIENQK